jgi:site-specific recombinase XerD
MITIQNARGQACGSIARSSGRSICTGHDLRHKGACRLLAYGVDIRTIQLTLGHSDIKTTQRYLNITDEELRKALTGVWERRRQLKAVGE